MIWSSFFGLMECLYQVTITKIPIVIGVLFTVSILIEAPFQPSVDEIFTWINAFKLIHHLLLVAFLLRVSISILRKQHHTVYLVDYACFKPNFNCRVPLSTFIEHLHLLPYIDDNTFNFVARVAERTGLGDETYLPPALRYIPPQCSFSDARDEAKMVMFSAINDLLTKTCINPSDIDILIVNCSIFAPTPSYTDMIINRYKLRSDIHSIHLSGMGCSAGLISVGLARNILQITPHGKHALVVSTETISSAFYKGRKRGMQLTNTLFRMGGAAVLLSTSRERARFRLRHLLRRITSKQGAYKCVFVEEDDEENIGVNLSKDLIGVASNTLKTSMAEIGRLSLPISEKLLFLLSWVAHKVLHGRTKQYVPDFCLAFEHFCIHTGGPAVIDAVQRNLKLPDQLVEASKMTLHRFGNTSSSSIWYELAYIEAKGRMGKGDRVLMIGFGSGYKCNLAVWECIHPPFKADNGPWTNASLSNLSVLKA